MTEAFKVARGIDTSSDRLRPASWRGWQLTTEPLALRFENDEVSGYSIDLDRMLTPAEVLDWVFQIHSKPWGAEAALGFLEAICDVLNPQANICTWGREKTFTPSALRVRVAEYLRTGD